MKIDPRVDEYVAQAAPFAQPILGHLRQLVHHELPEVEETIKWGMPHFVFNGSNLCHMAAFKAHCAFGFPRSEMVDVVGAERLNASEAMGSFGRISSKKDLPSDAVMRRFLKAAAQLAQQPRKSPVVRPRAKSVELPMPDDLAEALKAAPEAAKAFQNFSPSHRKEYIEWITEAKRPETRAKRLATIIEQLAEAKSLHWRYQRVDSSRG